MIWSSWWMKGRVVSCSCHMGHAWCCAFLPFHTCSNTIINFIYPIICSRLEECSYIQWPIMYCFMYVLEKLAFWWIGCMDLQFFRSDLLGRSEHLVKWWWCYQLSSTAVREKTPCWIDFSSTRLSCSMWRLLINTWDFLLWIRRKNFFDRTYVIWMKGGFYFPSLVCFCSVGIFLVWVVRKHRISFVYKSKRL